MSMTRIFHTVGQGAFYTERHETKDGGEFIIVYDCGTANKKGILEKEITSTFFKNDEIDILFISHFHNDHISGLGFLKNHCKKIKKVVLPYLDDAKTILKVSNYLSCGNSYSDLIDNPAGFFGDSTVVILVNPINPDSEINNEQREQVIEELISSEIDSGTKITSKNLIEREWFFIPFNYKHSERKKQFEDNSGLKLEDFDAANKTSVSKFKKEYKKIYGTGNNEDEKLNQNSMILFSGFGKPSHPVCCFSNNCNYHSCHYFYHRFYPFQIESGCIYFGDIDLNQTGIIDNIQKRLNKFLSFVGTIQIPHHGSKENFNSGVLDNLPEIKRAVISFGTDNSYGHPSSRVMSELLQKRIHPHFVTEKRDSVVIQHN